MNTVTNFITEVGPHIIPVMAVVFSYKGLEQRGVEQQQIWALILLLLIFTGLLSESLKKMVDLWTVSKARSITIFGLAIGLFLLEVVLIHEGMVWAFGQLLEGWMLWSAAWFFSLVNLFAKFAFIDGVIKTKPDDSQVDDVNQRLERVANQIDQTN
jgi:hypothetical protein